MKKSNKLSIFYVLSSLLLLSSLIVGGIYGIYVSVGLNFVKSSIANISDTAGTATNVSFGGTVNFESSMTGVIILSIILIVIAIFDIVALVKQITFFKQYKFVSDMKLTQKIEEHTKSKGSTIFFAVIVDLFSLGAGIAGIFINFRELRSGNISWVLQLIDGAVAVLALISLVLLIIKLRSRKKTFEELKKEHVIEKIPKDRTSNPNSSALDIDDIEYKLLKLKNMKSSKMINIDEYQRLHDMLLEVGDFENKNYDSSK